MGRMDSGDSATVMTGTKAAVIEASGAGTAAVGSNRRWWARRLGAFLGAAVYAYAVWAPWVTTSGLFISPSGSSFATGPSTSNGFAASLSIASYLLRHGGRSPLTQAANVVAAFDMWGWTVLGLLIAPLLWERHAPRVARLARWGFFVWVATVTLTSAVSMWVFLSGAERPKEFIVTDLSVSWGTAVAAIVLVALWAVAISLLRERTVVAVAPRIVGCTRRRLGGAAVVSAGILLWALGFFALPWATVNCSAAPLTLNHFAIGSCAGVDAGDALVYIAGGGNITANTPIQDVYPLLLGWALLALVAVWRRRVSYGTDVWVALWLTAATGAAYLATHGVAVALADQAHVASAATGVTGPWHADMGLFFCLLGLIAAWLGMIPLEAEARRR